ncbi:MAG: hypothetical protein KGD60_14400 [Candidatus Thorarchaeota archaeon]|nr:hypothetical protein [Candidatus Thorarchaeota archaeon]
MVLIVVALSFDILWTSGRIPIAEITVFIFALTIWAYGNLKGGIWEYPLKLGSFNLALILLTNFYVISIYGDLTVLALWEVLVGVFVMPLVCITIAAGLASYLKDTLDQSITRGILIAGTLGYIKSISAVIFLA